MNENENVTDLGQERNTFTPNVNGTNARNARNARVMPAFNDTRTVGFHGVGNAEFPFSKNEGLSVENVKGSI